MAWHSDWTYWLNGCAGNPKPFADGSFNSDSRIHHSDGGLYRPENVEEPEVMSYIPIIDPEPGPPDEPDDLDEMEVDEDPLEDC